VGASLHPIGIIAITPISLTPDDSQIYEALKQYKWDNGSRTAHSQRIRLAGLITMFLGRHGQCVASAGWDQVAIVPSLRDREGAHPLWSVIRMIENLSEVLVDALRPGPGASRIERNHGRPDAFEVERRLVEGKRILLDDTYTSGAHLQSACVGLRAAGAAQVVPVVVGRRLRRDWADSRMLLSWAENHSNPWLADRCIRCSRDFLRTSSGTKVRSR
jgi:hypothetical protein